MFVFKDPARHEDAEAAHWPPWQAAAVTYIRSLPDFHSPSWSEDTAQLVAFVFGVAVHFTADELWESLTHQLEPGQVRGARRQVRAGWGDDRLRWTRFPLSWVDVPASSRQPVTTIDTPSRRTLQRRAHAHGIRRG